MALDVHRFERAANLAVGLDRRAFMIVLEPFWTARFLVGWLGANAPCETNTVSGADWFSRCGGNYRTTTEIGE